MFNEENIRFRKLRLEDLPLMQQWLNEPHVHEWYDKEKENTLKEVTKRYAPKIKGELPTDCYLVLYENKPAAYMQTYKVNDWPEFGAYVDVDDKTACIDLFIGDPSCLGKGLGSLMLKKFLEEIVFANKKITKCLIDPEPKNIRAIKAYEKAGFIYVKTAHIPGEPDPKYLMEINAA